MRARWAIYAPMGIEARALRSGLRTATAPLGEPTGVVVQRTGTGPSRAARTARTRPAERPSAVAGIAGGLRGDLRPGDVVVADEVRTDPLSDGRTPGVLHLPAAPLVAAALRRRGLTVRTGPVVSTDHLVSGTDRDRLAATGALAVDTESAWVLSGEADAALACVRVVADPATGGLLRPATLAHLRAAVSNLPAVAAGLAEWAAATTVRQVLLASPRSFCAGGDRAIDVVEHMLVPDVATAERIEVEDPTRVSFLLQTTRAVDEARDVVDVLRRRFPALSGPGSDDICYATTNRQLALRAVAAASDVVLVLGSANSSNSLRLVEVAQRAGTSAYLVEDADGIDLRWLAGAGTVGVTAGASAAPRLVDQAVAMLRDLGARHVDEHVETTEDVRFTLPKEVRPA